jgi:hypothetical protein
MAIANLHKADKIVVGGSFTFNECRNWRLDAGMSSLIRRPAGHVAPMFRAGLQQRPVFTFTTPEIDVAWANIGQYGLAVTADTDIYEKLATATGNAARNASSHKRYRISDCFIFWSRVMLPHNGEGTIDISIIPVYDGSNEPIVPAGSTALVTTQASGNHFGAGPTAWNGTTLNGIQSIEIATNPDLIQEGGESEIWDTFVGIRTIEPVVTLQFRDATSLTGIGLDGTVLNGSTGLTLYGRHMTGVGRSANGSSAHIKLVGANGTILPQEISTQDSDPTMHSARVELVAASDSTDPMTISTAQAIS